jgi:hypothetical protein
MARLFAFAGLIGAGKTTAANFLHEKHGFVRTKFAGYFKAMLLAMGLTEEDLEDPIKKSTPHPRLCGRTPRHAMIALGTEWGRDLISPDLWTTLWTLDVEPLLSSGKDVVVDDLRFPNELRAVRRLGGVPLYIVGTRNTQPPVQHRSENPGMDGGCDATLYNTGSVTDFHHRLERFLDVVKAVDFLIPPGEDLGSTRP